MAGALGHQCLAPKTLIHSSKSEGGRSGQISCELSNQTRRSKWKPLASTDFLGMRFHLGRKSSLGRRNRDGASIPCAVLATDSPELVEKFNLDGNAQLQVTIGRSGPNSPLQVNIQVTNTSGSLVLHWGLIRKKNNGWTLPSHRPHGTYIYENQALRTSFDKTGHYSSLTLEINTRDAEAVEFLIIDETNNKWLKNNGQNFRIQLPSLGDVASSATLPEDLVQTYAYLRWERKGKQQYSPVQEKEEYEAARSELLQEISRGTTVEKLREKLTKKTQNSSEILTSEKNLPDELVQVQAYIRWEKAGKPSYNEEKQLMEFEEARKELLSELSKGVGLEDLKKKIMKGNIQSKVSKQLKTKKYFSVQRIQRKKRDVSQLIKKHDIGISKHITPRKPREPTALEIFSGSKEEEEGSQVWFKKFFKLENKDLLVLVTKASGKTMVYIATDREGPLVLHWGVSKKPREWMLPPLSMQPPSSSALENSCDTPFVNNSSSGSFYQTVEIAIEGDEYVGLPFVLHSDGYWMKNSGSDFYVDFSQSSVKLKKEIGDGKGTARDLLEDIAGLESEAERSLMHRFNVTADLVGSMGDPGELGLAGILVWMRFMATRQLTWNKNYNVKPREISKAQDRLTSLLEDIYKAHPQYGELIRMILSTVGRGGEGDVGQRIRDEILVIQRNNDCKGGMMEEWHQKLHNNTSPDDVVICQALIDYINADFDVSVYWKTLESNGINKARLLSYDRAIHSEPNFRPDQREGLLRDLGNYLRTLKAVHSGADLESSIATCMGYKVEGEGFMVGVQVNPIEGIPSELPEILQHVLEHIEDKNVEPLLEALLEAREELRPLLLGSHNRLKDLLFLDLALDSAVRTAIERGYEELNTAKTEKIMNYITLVVENLALSSDNNEDIIYCLKGWHHALEKARNNDGDWALYAKSFLDRTRLALASKAEHYQHVLQPSAVYLGSLLGIEDWAVNIFTEEIIRAGSAASLSLLLNRLDPVLRKVANLGSWQVISPVEVTGYVVVIDELLAVQNKSYSQPTILVAKSVKGEEEIPDGAVAVLTPDMPDVLSHVSVRARNGKVCFATCFDPNVLSDLQQKDGKLLQLKPTAADVIYREVNKSELAGRSANGMEEQPSVPISLTRKQFNGRYAISADEFNSDMVGAKSRNISYLRGKVPSWVGIPTSVALPFGVFEEVLEEESNKEVADELQNLKTELNEGDFSKLGDIRQTVLKLNAPPQLINELKQKMEESGMPWPGNEGEERWQQAWLAIKKVWASKWNERAYFSTRKVKLDHDYLSMAVLVQEIVSADYAFVIHTINPSSGDSTEIYTEVVKGLGETLVGAYPGRALSFICKKNDIGSPKLLGYPSKPVGLFIRRSIIFRSDSNGEDLEGYAGAGLYDSVPMDEAEKVVLDYSSDPLITDAGFRKSMLSKIAQAGSAIEELYGSPQDIEGVVKDGKIVVVQTRPQM
ncbi:pyruvate phosphate dikinase, PEP/pyruvate binding domain-containing protein [Wolffia australiana]